MMMRLVKMFLLLPIAGFKEARAALIYAEARVKDRTMHTEPVLQELTRQSVEAMLALVKYHLDTPAPKAKGIRIVRSSKD